MTNPLFNDPFLTQQSGAQSSIAPLQFMATSAHPITPASNTSAPIQPLQFVPQMQSSGGGSVNFNSPGQGALSNGYNAGLASMGNAGQSLRGTTLGAMLLGLSNYGASQNDGYSLGSSPAGYASALDAAAMGLGNVPSQPAGIGGSSGSDTSYSSIAGNGGGFNSDGTGGFGMNSSGGEWTGGMITQKDVVAPRTDGSPDNAYISAQTGEFVVNREAVKKYGPDLLKRINDLSYKP